MPGHHLLLVELRLHRPGLLDAIPASRLNAAETTLNSVLLASAALRCCVFEVARPLAWRSVFLAVFVCVQAPFIGIQTQAQALRVVLRKLIEKLSIQIKRCRNVHSRGLATDWVSLVGEEGELAQGARGGDTGTPGIAGETARGAMVSGTGDGRDVVS